MPAWLGGAHLDWRREWKAAFVGAAVIALFYWLPGHIPRVDTALAEAISVTHEYAREHLLHCFLPALFIAGAISTLIRRNTILSWLGPGAPRILAYATASIGGFLLTVCSCTVIPLFAGLYAAGAGLGPATTFLYSGPAINVLAIILTAQVLGAQLAGARAFAAVAFALLIGLSMARIFPSDPRRSSDVEAATLPDEEGLDPLPVTLLIGSLFALVAFANWARSGALGGTEIGPLTPVGLGGLVVAALVLGLVTVRWLGLGPRQFAIAAGATALVATFTRSLDAAFVTATVSFSWFASHADGLLGKWFASTWAFTKQILPLLFGGVWLAGLLFGHHAGHEGLVPARWIEQIVGGEGLMPTAVASLVGLFTYFATLTEIPILEALRSSGMGDGPSLALLLAGPSLSLPALFIIASVVGWRRTLAYGGLVALAATLAGLAYGALP